MFQRRLQEVGEAARAQRRAKELIHGHAAHAVDAGDAVEDAEVQHQRERGERQVDGGKRTRGREEDRARGERTQPLEDQRYTTSALLAAREQRGTHAEPTEELQRLTRIEPRPFAARDGEHRDLH